MSFQEIVAWTRHFGLMRERVEPIGVIVNLADEDLTSGPEELHLTEFLSHVSGLTLSRLHSLYYIGREFDQDPPGMHEYLQDESEDDYRGTLLDKLPLYECLGDGLVMLHQLGANPESDWHVTLPTRPIRRDFVATPAPHLPVASRNAATFSELQELFDWRGWQPLVAAQDVDMGPYTSCILVNDGEIEALVATGYRILTDAETKQARDISHARSHPTLSRGRQVHDSADRSPPSGASTAR